MYLYLPSRMNFTAPPLPANTTFLGFHVNLYFQGLSSLPGAGSPPVNDSKEFMTPPRSRISSMTFMALR
ncbi:MAG: Uncharacterised protein [Flavobacteriia bacterium]|nr:MAG: Uncharacterised protein [Flavobacteriia bacterium]